MDAATAALLGATVGLTGTLVAPMVTAYQAKRAKHQDLMRDAYARGFACLAKIPRCETVDDHMRLRDKMLEALAHIEIVGTKKTSDHYSAVVESYEAWKIQDGPNNSFELSAKKFQESSRADIDSGDVVGTPIPSLVVRVVVAVLVLAVYWWARFPALLKSSDRMLGGLEFGIVILATLLSIWLVVDASVRLAKFVRRT
ncbi:hypothetical protein [Amycolatopsis anabasis]|uniref:hypothetical protein n=1 Tax=Amycolatopsis anabasis TaxID=1840409 RepID=UPI00131A60A1|nr:hypothetical protein [Amycolatopsis anabasis]